eukprot:7658157-Alexandrium_andersonii.AAC.1
MMAAALSDAIHGARTGEIIVGGDFNCDQLSVCPTLEVLRSAGLECMGALPHAAGAAAIDQLWASPLLRQAGPFRACPPLVRTM